MTETAPVDSPAASLLGRWLASRTRPDVPTFHLVAVNGLQLAGLRGLGVEQVSGRVWGGEGYVEVTVWMGDGMVSLTMAPDARVFYVMEVPSASEVSVRAMEATAAAETPSPA